MKPLRFTTHIPMHPSSTRILAAFLAAASTAFAAETTQPLPGEISRTVDKVDGRRITFVKVTPPAPVYRAPTPVSISRMLSAEEQAKEVCLADLPVKPEKLFSLSGTVYIGNPTVTELWWTHEGREWRALSNVDFRLVNSAFGHFETSYAGYMLSAAMDYSTSSDPHKPQGVFFTTSNAQFLVFGATDADIKNNSEAFDALNFLHAYHDTHKEELTDAFVKHQAEEAAQKAEAERQAREPKKKPDVVIRYWRMEAPASNR